MIDGNSTDGNMSVRCVADVGAVLGEGPVWDARDGGLYWVDIEGRRIFRHDAATGALREWKTPFRVSSLAPRAAGGFVAGTERGFAFVEPEAGRFDVFAHPEADRLENRSNDGKLDARGRFWGGTMHNPKTKASGALYRVDADRTATRVDDNYRITNGPAFSLDGRRMYHSDTARQTTYVFDLDEAGQPSNRRPFLTWSEGEGFPDGMTVDAEDGLWIAFWGASCLRRYAPDGMLLATLPVPVQQPSSCAFGGPDLDRLFITSARESLTDAELANQPEAGGLFEAHVGVRGVPTVPFAG